MKGSGLKYFKLQMVLELSRNYLELVSVKSCVKMGKHLQSPRTKSHQEIATDAVNSLLEVKEVKTSNLNQSRISIIYKKTTISYWKPSMT